MKNKNREKIYSITIIFLMIDQIIKLIVKNNMNLHQEISVIPNFFSLYYIENKGAAFSIFNDQTTFLIITTTLFLIIMNHYIKTEKKFTKLSIISLGILLGGMFGNLIDRILYSGVIDYLSFTIFNYNFPIFNFADIGITLGTFLLVINFIKEEKNDIIRKKKEEHHD